MSKQSPLKSSLIIAKSLKFRPPILRLRATFSQNNQTVCNNPNGTINTVENQFISAQKMANNRNVETGIIKGSEAPSDPRNEKISPGWTRTNSLPVNSRLLRH